MGLNLKDWTLAEAEQVLRLMDGGAERRDVARLFGVTPNAISGVIERRKTWSRYRRRYDNHQETIDAIAALWAATSMLDISMKLGLSESFVRELVTAARKAGDQRFPPRKSKVRGDRYAGSDDAGLREPELAVVASHYLAERRPCGRKYTLQTLGAAMAARPYRLHLPPPPNRHQMAVIRALRNAGHVVR